MPNSKLIAVLLLFAQPLAALADDPAQRGKWWCESDASQPPIYMSQWDIVTASSAALAREFAQVLAQSYSYKGAVACYLDLGTHSTQDYGTHIQLYKDAGKKMIAVPWKPPSSEPSATPQSAPTAAPHPASAPTPAPLAATAPAPARPPAAQAPSNQPPYVCLATSEAIDGQTTPTTSYVTQPFDSAKPTGDVVRAWRLYVASHFQLADADTGNCSRRDAAKRQQLEAHLAKSKGSVVHVSFAP